MVQHIVDLSGHEAIQKDLMLPQRDGEQQDRGVGGSRIEDAVEDRADEYDGERLRGAHARHQHH